MGGPEEELGPGEDVTEAARRSCYLREWNGVQGILAAPGRGGALGKASLGRYIY